MADVGTLCTQLSRRRSRSWNDQRRFLKWAVAIGAAMVFDDQPFNRFHCSILEFFRLL